jgi:RNA polymerase sigma factor (sigma-70 family)
MLRDPQLLLAYRHGSEEAFLALYERYAGPLRRFLQGGFSFSSQGRQCRFRGTDTSMDVESLVQETFARAFAKTTRENYDGIRPFQTYLFSIAKNLVLRECHHRDRLIVVDYVEDSADGQGVFSTPNENGVCDNPEQRVANKQLEGIMSAFIGELTLEERRLFSLRFAKGFTQEASADMMRTTRARIKLLEKNIRKRFLERLKENGYFTSYVPNPRWKRQQTRDELAV